jgi:hypothetical protein
MPRRPAQERAESDSGILRGKINEFASLSATELQQSFKYGSNLWPNERPHYRLTTLAILNDD